MGKKDRQISFKEIAALNRQHDAQFTKDDIKLAGQTNNSFYNYAEVENLRRSLGTGWSKRHNGPAPHVYHDELVRERKKEFLQNQRNNTK
jgi:hypothetical protein